MPTISNGPITSLAAVTATGAGTAIDLSRFASNTNSIGLYVSTTGSPTAVSITIEMSPDDGTTWYSLSGSALSATASTCQNYSIPPGASKVRARLGTLTGGTAPTVTAQIAQRYESAV